MNRNYGLSQSVRPLLLCLAIHLTSPAYATQTAFYRYDGLTATLTLDGREIFRQSTNAWGSVNENKIRPNTVTLTGPTQFNATWDFGSVERFVDIYTVTQDRGRVFLSANPSQTYYYYDVRSYVIEKDGNVRLDRDEYNLIVYDGLKTQFGVVCGSPGGAMYSASNENELNLWFKLEGTANDIAGERHNYALTCSYKYTRVPAESIVSISPDNIIMGAEVGKAAYAPFKINIGSRPVSNAPYPRISWERVRRSSCDIAVDIFPHGYVSEGTSISTSWGRALSASVRVASKVPQVCTEYLNFNVEIY